MSESEKKAWFYRNSECEYFPCHKTDDSENFNCLFCYCPLYTLGENCGGGCRFTDEGIKDCSQCLMPHKRDSVHMIAKRFKDINAVVQSQRKRVYNWK